MERGTGDSDGLWVGARTEEGRGRVKSQAWLVPGDYLNTRCCICLLNKGYMSTDAKRLIVLITHRVQSHKQVIVHTAWIHWKERSITFQGEQK